MGEASRFLRYVIPGLVFFVEIVFYLFLSCPKELRIFVSWISANSVDKGISAVLGTFLVSGGVGFLLGIGYYTIIWTPPISRLGVDHRKVLEDAISRGLLSFKTRSNDKLQGRHTSIFTQVGAWRIMSAFWHTRTITSKRIKAATVRLDRLADIVHGLGAASLGSLVALPVWLLFHYRLTGGYPEIEASLFAIILIPAVHVANYLRSVKDLENIIDMVFFQELIVESQGKGIPVELNITPSELV